MNEEFVCNHCGFCCTDENTQINLTFLDIKLLSEKLEKPVSQLFADGDIAFTPFANGEDLSLFEVEIGLKKPCKFFKNNNCSIYHLRPMNCRTFPYWLINHDIENDVECIQNIKLTDANKNRYKTYEKKVGRILVEQSEVTDYFLRKIGAKKTINLSDDEAFQKLIKKFRNAKDVETQKQIAKKMLILAEKQTKQTDHKMFIPLIEKEIERNNYDKLIDIIMDADTELND